jgi:ribosome-interacting GTPase 1
MVYFMFAATEYHLGLLKAKLAKYRVQLLEGSKTKSEKVMGWNWKRDSHGWRLVKLTQLDLFRVKASM